MLQRLVISDLAIIQHLELDFASGMTVFTGETGAGKSILLDAIGLILGDRADNNLIRGGADKTEITGVFSLTDLPMVKSQLDSLDIDTDDNELFVRRVVSKDGRSRAYLNRSPVPLQTLREIGQYLIDIYGQHAHQSLGKPNIQRQLLDENGDYETLLSLVRQLYLDWKQLKQELSEIKTNGENYEDRLTLLRYQIDELNEFNISENEYETLNQTHKKLANSQQIISTCAEAINRLSESDNAFSQQLAIYQSKFADLEKYDASLSNVTELFNQAMIQVDEAIAELRLKIEQTDNDQESLTQIEHRLDRYHELARKHHVKPDQLTEHFQALEDELNKLEHGQEHYDALQAKLENINIDYKEQAKQLYAKRQELASSLSVSVTEKMHELGIGGTFSISVEQIDDEVVREYGMDTIQFLVSTNPGQPLRPLTKVASGGELSRLSLAIQIIGISTNSVPTLIFDEVDTGISGGIAEVVGKMLATLSNSRQIFCVTHLAQVASCGQHHCRVSKKDESNQIKTHVEQLNRVERIDELARMLAGLEITKESRANAEKLLETIH
ncbi:MAG: DNA repair protein RecN [Pseudomonadota bacterium]